MNQTIPLNHSVERDQLPVCYVIIRIFNTKLAHNKKIDIFLLY